MPVYLDVLVLLNFVVDLLLLLGTNRLAGHSPDVKRALPAAALGGIYGGVCVLPEVQFLSGTLWRIIALTLMGIIAFGYRRDAVRRGILFILLSMALGGVATGMTTGGFWTLVLSAAAVCVMCVLGFRGKVGAEYVAIELAGLRLTALRDTGHSLTDPITGQQVLIVSASAGAALLGLDAKALRDPIGGMEKVSGARLIPYHTVGKSAMLLAKRYDNVKIGEKKIGCLVAFAPEEIGRGKPYDALMGGQL